MTGLSLCVGEISALFALQAMDCAACVSDEVTDAGILLVMIVMSNISADASAPRQTFAFARDNDLALSRWISKVSSDLFSQQGGAVVAVRLVCACARLPLEWRRFLNSSLSKIPVTI